MNDPFVTSCGDCFESWTAPEPVLDEVVVHIEETQHRYDINIQDVE